MDLQTILPFAVLGVAGLFAVLIGGNFYVGRVRRLRQEGPQVEAGRYGPADLLVAAVLVLFFLWIAVNVALQGGAGEEEAPLSTDALFSAMTMHFILVGGIWALLSGRGLSIGELFGLRRVSLREVLKWGTIGLIAAWPLVKLVILLTALVLQESAEQQSIVTFFSDAVKAHQWMPIVATLLTGIVVAPLAEEFVFRGFLYGVAKRYTGPLAAAIVTSLIFAAIHFNALSFPALFVLALCFVVLYETTGSLLVPMLMHALFNAVNLLETILLGRFLS